MASQQTPNYRLSRWAGTDRILVEEFNDNWDKIDAALKSNADGVAAETAAREAADTALEKEMGLQLIQTITSKDSGSYLEFAAQIDWSQWAEVYMLVEAALTDSNATYSMYCKGETGSMPTIAGFSGSTGCLVFYPMFGVSSLVHGHNWSGAALTGDAVYQNIRYFVLTASKPYFLAGSKLTFYGRK